MRYHFVLVHDGGFVAEEALVRPENVSFNQYLVSSIFGRVKLSSSDLPKELGVPLGMLSLFIRGDAGVGAIFGLCRGRRRSKVPHQIFTAPERCRFRLRRGIRPIPSCVDGGRGGPCPVARAGRGGGGIDGEYFLYVHFST